MACSVHAVEHGPPRPQNLPFELPWAELRTETPSKSNPQQSALVTALPTPMPAPGRAKGTAAVANACVPLQQ